MKISGYAVIAAVAGLLAACAGPRAGARVDIDQDAVLRAGEKGSVASNPGLTAVAGGVVLRLPRGARF